MIRMLISIPIITVILVFAFVNNELVTFNLWPFEIEITSSFSVVVIALILLGFVLGRISAWMAYLPLRKDLVLSKMQVKKLSKENKKVSDEVEELKSSAAEGAPKERGSVKETLARLFKSPER